jgi:ABC-2 type transport system permease protein
MFVIPPLVGILPSSITNVVDKFLPSNAGGAVWTINPDPHTLSPWVGFGVFCAWTALSFVLAAILLRTRDT